MNEQLALAIVLAAAPFASIAGELSYNYLEAGYLTTDIDDLGDGDGYGINGSAALGETIHLFGGFSAQQGDGDEIDVDLDQFRVGLGVNYAIAERVDFLTRFSYDRSEADVAVDGFGRVSSEVDGWALAGYTALDEAEVEGIAVDIDDSDDSETYGRIGAQFKFHPNWGVVGETRFSSDAKEYFAGLRAGF